MASSNMVTTNTDLPRHSSSPSSSPSDNTILHHNLHMTYSMDEILSSIYTHSSAPSPSSSPPPRSHSWKDMILTNTNTNTDPHIHTEDVDVDDDHDAAVADHSPLEKMTLEAFLTKAGCAAAQDDGLTALPSPRFPAVPVEAASPPAAIGGKGNRRAVEEPLDKATLQKQRRMIKNRESAARSRERKQAYTTELEFLVQQLETENARLLNEEADKKRQRFKELTECIIPVVEKRKPKRLLRTSSVQSL